MKKVILVAVGVVFLATAVLYAQKLDKDQSADVLQGALQKEGYTTTVGVGDVDSNGGQDFSIKYISGKEGQQVVIFLATITGAVGALRPMLTWESDKVWVILDEDTLWNATTVGCEHCYKKLTEGASDQDMLNCINDIWHEIKRP